MSRGTALAPVAVAGATVAVSFSAIFIRLAEAPATTVVWVRMAMATILLLPWLGRDLRSGATPSGRGEWAAVGASGLCLATHFLAWTAALGDTSVASAVLLVSLHPALVAAASRRLLGEPIPARVAVGLALALAGTLVTTGGDIRLGPAAARGDLEALLGAVTFAAYVVIGRRLRQRRGTATYSVAVDGIVALVALAACALTGAPVLPTPKTALACFGLAAVCTVGGHAVFTWSLRHLRAAVVSSSFLGEPPITVLLALPILGEHPSPAALGGGAIILTGLALVLTTPDAIPATDAEVVSLATSD